MLSSLLLTYKKVAGVYVRNVWVQMTIYLPTVLCLMVVGPASGYSGEHQGKDVPMRREGQK